MALFLTMFPYYVMGNLHCLGMCGPLVMMIGAHRYRYAYFLGRLLSFSLAGMMAGEVGAVLQGYLQEYHLSAALTFALGLLMLLAAAANWTGWRPRIPLPKSFKQAGQSISLLMLKDTAPATFMFGLLTVALPCGQTLVVFSACALTGQAWTGFFNGAAFALLTSPSLWVAMHTLGWFRQAKEHFNLLIGSAAFIAGVLAICRGLADAGVISHLAFGHVVLY